MARTKTPRSSSSQKHNKTSRREPNARPSSTRPTRPRPTRPLNESQETLTQIDFVRISRSVSDEEDSQNGVEDDDFVPQNPKKRKRRAPDNPQKRQQTLTQIDWIPRGVASDSDSDSDSVPQGEEGEAPSHLGYPLHQPENYVDDTAERSMLNDGFHDEATYPTISSTQSETGQNPLSKNVTDTPGSAAAQNPVTPKTVRVQEIPSSQTPMPSPLLTRSGRSIRRSIARSPTRSPLKEVSSNSRSLKIYPAWENSFERDSSDMPAQKFSDAPNSQKSIIRSASELFDDSDADDSMDREEGIQSNKRFGSPSPRSRKEHGALSRSQELTRVRSDSEEIASQINREVLFSQQRDWLHEQRDHGMLPNMGSQAVDDVECNILEPDDQVLRPSQVSTVDVTQEASSSRSRRLASLPALSPSSPHHPKSREPSVCIVSSPNAPRSRTKQPETITLSQLLPDSLMNFNLPAPPDSSQNGGFYP
ncbi:MAG: hypothetical protein M1822_008781 [Bathelium mastoideum]|nr:MAG: hypothetical protein M1822_008781 [Bathelium mastoideum]